MIVHEDERRGVRERRLNTSRAWTRAVVSVPTETRLNPHHAVPAIEDDRKELLAVPSREVLAKRTVDAIRVAHLAERSVALPSFANDLDLEHRGPPMPFGVQSIGEVLLARHVVPVED